MNKNIENRRVSIIVPAKNEQKYIAKCIRSLLALNCQATEIIIINDGSTDSTGEILAEFKDKIKIIELNGAGPGRARNLAIKEAKGDFIAFTDADCVVDIKWLDELLFAMKDASICGAGGSQEIPKDESTFGILVGKFFKTFGFASDYIHTESKISSVEHNPTCNAIYRKEVFKENNFVEDLWPCEDLEFDLRLGQRGLKLANNPKAIVYHHRPSTFRGFMKMMARYGRAHSKLLAKKGFCQTIHYLPLIIFLITIFSVFLYDINVNFFMFLYAMIIPVGFGYIFLKNKNISDSVKVFLLFMSVIIVWLYGYFAGAGEDFYKSK